MPLTVASECSQSQLVPRENGRNQGFLRCSFSLGEVPAAPASRCSHSIAAQVLPCSSALFAQIVDSDFAPTNKFQRPGSEPSRVGKGYQHAYRHRYQGTQAREQALQKSPMVAAFSSWSSPTAGKHGVSPAVLKESRSCSLAALFPKPRFWRRGRGAR